MNIDIKPNWNGYCIWFIWSDPSNFFNLILKTFYISNVHASHSIVYYVFCSFFFFSIITVWINAFFQWIICFRERNRWKEKEETKFILLFIQYNFFFLPNNFESITNKVNKKKKRKYSDLFDIPLMLIVDKWLNTF